MMEKSEVLIQLLQLLAICVVILPFVFILDPNPASYLSYVGIGILMLILLSLLLIEYKENKVQ